EQNVFQVITGCAMAVGLSLNHPKSLRPGILGKTRRNPPKSLRPRILGKRPLLSPSFPSNHSYGPTSILYLCNPVAMHSQQTNEVHMNRLAYPLPEARALNHPKSLRPGHIGEIASDSHRPLRAVRIPVISRDTSRTRRAEIDATTNPQIEEKAMAKPKPK